MKHLLLFVFLTANVAQFALAQTDVINIVPNGGVGINAGTVPAESSLLIGEEGGAEGGQIQINPSVTGGYSDAYFIDVYGSSMRILRGTTAGTSSVVLGIDNTNQLNIGTAIPAARFTVGNSNQFRVSSTGDLIRINDLAYTWPAAHASGALINNGTGGLSWGNGSSLFTAGTGLSWSGSTLNSVWTANGNDIYNNNTANVGVGITVPVNKLDVAGQVGVGYRTPAATQTGTANWGNALVLSGGTSMTPSWDSDNSDPLWLSRYNVASNQTELRVIIGDDPGTVTDKFVIGAMSGFGNFNQGGTWTPYLTLQMDGKLGLGVSTMGSGPNTTSRIEIADENGLNSDVQIKTAASGIPTFTMATSAGTLASPAAIANNARIGYMDSWIYHGSGWGASGAMGFYADGTPVSGSSSPGRIELATTNAGSLTPTTKLWILNAGSVGIGASPTTTYKLHVQGGDSKFAADGSEQALFGLDRLVGLNDLRFFTDNTGTAEHMRLDASGNLGLGVIPAAGGKLDVNGVINSATGYRYANTNQAAGTYLRSAGSNFIPSTIQAGDIPNLNGTYVDLTNNQTAAGIKTWSSQARFSNAIQPSVGNATTVGLYWPTDPGGGTGDAAWMRYYVESGENTKLQIGIGNDPDDDISFYQSGIEAMNIYNGLVGINKTVPESRLHVSGGVPTGIGGVPAATVAIIENGTGNNYLTFRNTGDNNTYGGILFQDNNVGGYIAFRNCCTGNSSDAMLYGAYQDHIFQNGTSGTVDGLTETMRIKQNGNVGIGGIVSPSYKLQVNGDIYANGGWVRVSGNQGLYFESWGGGWYMSDATYMRTYNNKAVLTSGGLFTQGTASTLYGTNASIYANNANVAGGGIMVSDDGGFFDYNDGPVTFNGSTGLVIAGNSGSGSSNAYLRVKQLAGTGNRPVYADANGTLTTTGCRSGFWAVADGRICVESTLRGPNNMFDAIGVCKGVAPGCRVCEHNDLQQACGSGIANPYGATYGWYGDHGVASGGNWDDEYGVWNVNGCGNNNDDPARHAGDHSLNYRCCY